jgi:hypothetical protein
LYQEGKNQMENGSIINEVMFNEVENDISTLTRAVANEDFIIIEEFKSVLLDEKMSRIFHKPFMAQKS